MENVEIDVLLNEEKYQDVIDLMKDEYVELFSGMLAKKGVTAQNDDFYCYTTKVMNEYPELVICIDSLRKGMLDKELSYLDEIELLKNTYNYIKKYEKTF